MQSDDLVGNVMRGAEFELQRQIARPGGPVDKGEWLMTPQTVNAYYNSATNEITFPAAILRPPFFDMNADDAVNYGGIGAVIGHEISHGFDDSGRAVRRRRQPARLVDGRRRRQVQAARRRAGRSSLPATACSTTAT